MIRCSFYPRPLFRAESRPGLARRSQEQQAWRLPTLSRRQHTDSSGSDKARTLDACLHRDSSHARQGNATSLSDTTARPKDRMTEAVPTSLPIRKLLINPRERHNAISSSKDSHHVNRKYLVDRQEFYRGNNSMQRLDEADGLMIRYIMGQQSGAEIEKAREELTSQSPRYRMRESEGTYRNGERAWKAFDREAAWEDVGTEESPDQSDEINEGSKVRQSHRRDCFADLPHLSISQKREMGIWVQTPVWTEKMRILLRKYDKRYPRNFMQAHPNLKFYPDTPKHAAEALKRLRDGVNLDDFFLTKLNMRDVVKVSRWEQVAMFLMDKQPADAIRFLDATLHFENRTKRHYQIAINYLVAHYHYSLDDDRVQRLIQLVAIIKRLVPFERLRWSDKTIWVLIESLPAEDLLGLFDFVSTHQVVLHGHTWLQFSSYLTKYGKFEQALESLFRAHRTGLMRDGDKAFARVSASLLRSAIKAPDGLRVCIRLVDYLAERGLRMTTTVSNILILNAIDAQDMNTAMSIYDSMLKLGPAPDKFTFMALLEACKQNIGDAELIHNVIRDAIGSSLVNRVPLIAQEILSVLALHHTKVNPTNAFDILSDAYAELFDLKPMHQLGLLTNKKQTETKIMPTVYVMSIMLWTYVRHALIKKHPVSSVQTRYAFWSKLVRSDGSFFSSMLSNNYMHDAFVFYFTRVKNGMLLATQVIKDFQRPTAPDSDLRAPKAGAVTWSLLASGFVRQGKPELAEQILEHMRKLGHEPTATTWKSLLHNYAGAQNMGKILDIVKEMEDSNSSWDEFSQTALAKFHDQHRLRTELTRRFPNKDAPLSAAEEDARFAYHEPFGKDDLPGSRISSDDPSDLVEIEAKPHDTGPAADPDGFSDLPSEITSGS